MTNIYVAGLFEDQARWDDLISRLTWYFTPYLDRIDRIEICAGAEQIAAAAIRGPLDPAIAGHMPALKARLVPVSADHLARRLSEVDPSRHLFLLADEALEPALKAQIDRFRAKGRFYRIDPRLSRNEGSLSLWAGVNAFCDQAAETETYRARFAAMAAEIGSFERAYVFGTGPSLSPFVEGHDFEGSLTIVANSIVMNNDLLDALKPRLIVAADPIFHAGCSSYAAAFRAALEAAMERTGAWFLCPLRDVKIYATYLPAHLQARIIGIPFDAKAPPPTDLRQSFALHPYPNILTLMLLPLASTFAREVRIAGCDGRPVTENRSFWTHDKKAQFVDEMDNIKAVHPAFFAIDYNNYYFDHARELEGVLGTMEAAGRRCVMMSRSFIPALRARETEGLRPPAERPDRPFAPAAMAIVDPDAKGDWGHFLAYDRRLAAAAADLGLAFTVIGRTDLPQEARPAEVGRLIGTLTRHSWTLGNKWPATDPEDLTAFAFEIDDALGRLEAEIPDGDIALFMYCGSLEVMEILEHILSYHPRVRAVINLFWSYNFDIADPAYRGHWRALLARVAEGRGFVRVMHSTPQIAREFRDAWGIDIPVLPHASTTFGDARAAALAAAPARGAPRHDPPRVLFPGGARREKGYLLAAEACGILARDGDLDLVLRARLDGAEPALVRAVEALDPARVTLEAGDFAEPDFIDWLAQADVLVVPYLPEAFSNRTSGMLVDAMLLGIPVVTVDGTWMADELAASGGGLAVAAEAGALAAGIRAVLADYGRYAAATRAGAARYMDGSTWRALAGRVLEQVQAPSASADPAPLAADRAPVPAPAGPLPAPVERDAWDDEAHVALYHWSEDMDAPARLAALPEQPPQDGDGLLLVVSDPALRIADTLARGRSEIGPLLEDWQREATAALALLRRGGNRVVALEARALAADPEAMQALVRSRLPGIRLPDPGPMAAGDDPDPILLALADLFLRDRPALLRLRAELRARALAPDGAAPARATDPAQAMQAWQRLASYRALAAAREAEIADLETRLAAAEARDAEARRAQALRADQLRQLQATVESFGRDADGLRARLAARNAEFDATKAASDRVHAEAEGLTMALEEMRRSSSWRLTRPLRAMRRLLPGGAGGGAGG